MKKVKVAVLRTAGTNCDRETAFAFQKVGATCDFVHINKLISSREILDEYKILAIPGGFTYGDDIASGKILANELKNSLNEEIIKFITRGKLIIGICNGFQVLVKSGLLPNIEGGFDKMEVTLSLNDSDKFEARWVYLKPVKSKCVWTKNIKNVIYLPVAHGEGKFIPADKKILTKLKKNNQIVFEYSDEKGKGRGYPWNPNGSVANVAGICDPTGRIFGLMPHPERHIERTQHPRWTRESSDAPPCGLAIFENGVKAASQI